MYTGTTRRKDTTALVEAATKLFAFRQPDGMSLHDYFETFKGLVKIYEHHGGCLGQDQTRIEAHLVDPDILPHLTRLLLQGKEPGRNFRPFSSSAKPTPSNMDRC